MVDFIYELKDSLYLNITNRCNNACTFCIKYKNRKFEDKHELWMTHEPSADEIIKQITDVSKYRQFVFCGYGEPLIRLETVKQVSKYLKEHNAYVRVDTDGQANLFHGRNIVPEISGSIDKINISLNAHDAKTYNKLCRSVFGEKAYRAIIDFARSAKEFIPKTILTAVELPGVDVQKCGEIGKELGIEFRLRPYYERTYTA